MFRQILVHHSHRDYQRILWRDSTSEPIQHYRLKTVTYGTASATYLATRTIQQVALDYHKTHPLVARVILEDFYVDDVITGADTVDELIEIQQQTIQVLAFGGFNLRKFVSNSSRLLNSIAEHLREYSPLDLTDTSTVKLLGLQWYPTEDCFTYRVTLSDSFVPTKRSILSDISRIFDSLGFVSPVVVLVKILLQEIWLKKYDWDENVCNEISNKWNLIRQQLQSLENIKVERKLFTIPSYQEYHGFCDASERVYSAVIYSVSRFSNGTVNTTIVAAKSKVAPLKRISLPRLEFQGALLLTRLFLNIIDALELENSNLFAWTDSQIVLAWPSSHR